MSSPLGPNPGADLYGDFYPTNRSGSSPFGVPFYTAGASGATDAQPGLPSSTNWLSKMFSTPESALKNIQKNQNAPDLLTGTDKSVAGTGAATVTNAVNEYFGRATVVILGFIFVAAGLVLFGKENA